MLNVPVTSTLYVPAFEAKAVNQSNDFDAPLNTKKVGRIVLVVLICAVYVYIASVQV